MSSRCRSCGADVIWIRTAAGRPMPLDSQASPEGTVRIVRPGLGEVVGRDTPAEAGGPLYRSHFASCPHAGSWRRRQTDRTPATGQQDTDVPEPSA